MPNFNYTNSPPAYSNSYQPMTLPFATSAKDSLNPMMVFVNSEAEVNNYPVAAGLTMLLLCFRENKFWLKSTSINGIPEPIRSFSFSEITPKLESNSDSVSREEFNTLSEKLDKLIESLGGNK